MNSLDFRNIRDILHKSHVPGSSLTFSRQTVAAMAVIAALIIPLPPSRKKRWRYNQVNHLIMQSSVLHVYLGFVKSVFCYKQKVNYESDSLRLMKGNLNIHEIIIEIIKCISSIV